MIFAEVNDERERLEGEIEILKKQNSIMREALEWVSSPPDYNADFYRLRDKARQALRECDDS